MLADPDRRRAAAELAEAAARRSPIAPLSSRYDGLDPDDAYAIQRINIDARIGAGARVKGHKIGLTAKVMQEMLGVDEPDYGHLLDDMFVFEDFEVEAAELCAPRVEIEVAFVLGRPLAGPGINVADVIAATDFVLPAIEIIDSRVADWKIALVDTIADNASAARVVLGGRPVPLSAVDLRAAGATLIENGTAVETGTTAAVLGNPATAVAWLANRLGAYGTVLEAGHVIMPGACTRAIDVRAGSDIRAEFEGIGGVGVRFV